MQRFKDDKTVALFPCPSRQLTFKSMTGASVGTVGLRFHILVATPVLSQDNICLLKLLETRSPLLFMLFPRQFSERSFVHFLENSPRSCDSVAVVTQIIYNTMASRSPLSLSHEFPSRGEDAHAAVFFNIET